MADDHKPQAEGKMICARCDREITENEVAEKALGQPAYVHKTPRICIGHLKQQLREFVSLSAYEECRERMKELEEALASGGNRWLVQANADLQKREGALAVKLKDAITERDEALKVNKWQADSLAAFRLTVDAESNCTAIDRIVEAINERRDLRVHADEQQKWITKIQSALTAAQEQAKEKEDQLKSVFWKCVAGRHLVDGDEWYSIWTNHKDIADLMVIQGLVEWRPYQPAPLYCWKEKKQEGGEGE